MSDDLLPEAPPRVRALDHLRLRLAPGAIPSSLRFIRHTRQPESLRWISRKSFRNINRRLGRPPLSQASCDCNAGVWPLLVRGAGADLLDLNVGLADRR